MYSVFRYALLAVLGSGFAHAEIKWETTALEISPKSTEVLAPAEFRFTNAGLSAVTIQEVRPDCSCITAPLERRTYHPGESGKVAVVFNVKGQVGEHHVPIQVTSLADGNTATAVLILHVKIRDVVVFSERFLYWRPNNDLVPKTVTITVDPQEDLTIQGARSENPAFQVELAPTQDPRRFELRVTPPAERVRTFAQIVVTTASSGNSQPTEHRLVARIW